MPGFFLLTQSWLHTRRCRAAPTRQLQLSVYAFFPTAGDHMNDNKRQAGAAIPALEPGSDATPEAVSRRRFVAAGVGVAVGLGSGLGLAGCGGGNAEEGQRFGYGVASGDPLSDRVILWTRVNVSSPTQVQWEIATDSTFTNVVGSGT